MDSILVVNAGSSSIKFELFAVDGAAKLTRKLKGQMDGIGTRPRLRASGADRMSLIDREYPFPTCQRRCSQLVHGCAKSIARHRVRSAIASCMAAPSMTVRS
jgi:acetate kinase